MRTLSAILILSVTIVSCGEQKPFVEHAASEYAANNEDKFGFLVFEKNQADSFVQKYSPLRLDNSRLDNSYKNLLQVNSSFNANEKKFDKHSIPAEESDLTLARQVLNAALGDTEEYFNASLQYLFFYECLPAVFQHKWTQTYGGDLQFNVTFFNLLRVKCKEFEAHVTNDSFHWDKNMAAVFAEQQFNEISSENAALIKDCIDKDPAFSDNKLQPDKDNFIFFLDQVIAKKWRLFIVDNNN
jgi:hypothetical protein